MNCKNDSNLIETRKLCKSYLMGDVEVHALREVDLSISSGEFVAVSGQSGSGKSTLLNILGLLDRPTSGEYIFEGRAASSLSRNERADIRNSSVGFVFQSFNLLPRASALENVELPLNYSRVPLRQRREKAAELLDRVGLSGRGKHHPSQLSGGQQQRVAIARALVNSPSLLMADEPTGNLDSTTGEEIMNLLQELHQSQGITILMVTHEPNIAAYAQRLIVLKDGFIQEDTRTPGLQ